MSDLERYQELLKKERKLLKERKELQTSLKLLQQLASIADSSEDMDKHSLMDRLLLLLKEIIWIQSAGKHMKGDKILETAEMIFGKAPFPVREMEMPEGQMTLPGLENDLKKTEIHKRKIAPSMFLEKECFVKACSKVSVLDGLKLHSKKMLADFCRYLQIEVVSQTDCIDFAEEIFQHIYENPYIILPTLSESAIELLCAFPEMKDGDEVIICDNNVDALIDLLLWGFLWIEITAKNGKLYIELSVTKETEEHILPAFLLLKEQGVKGEQLGGYFQEERYYRLNEIYDAYETMFKQIKTILILYGTLEIEELYRMFGHLLNIELENEEFKRFIFLWGTLHKKWATALDKETKKSYIGFDLEMMQLLRNRQSQLQRVSYYEYDSFEDAEKRASYSVNLWSPIDAVIQQWNLSKEELAEYALEYCMEVATGKGVHSIITNLMDDFIIEEALDEAILWRQIVIMCMEYPNYVLKGNNRIQAEKKYRVSRYEGLFKESNNYRVAKAHLHELPVALQEQLADRIVLSIEGEPEDTFYAEKGLDRKYYANRIVCTVLVLNMVEAYSRMNQGLEKEKREVEVKRSVKDWCRDAQDEDERHRMLDWCREKGLSIQEDRKTPKKVLIGDENTDTFYWEDMEPVSQPVVKTQKIYPNAPCPCGSGKKYKKCCGK